MTDIEARKQFAEKVRHLEPFKHLQFHRLKNGEFIELAAEYAFIGYSLALPTPDNKTERE